MVIEGNGMVPIAGRRAGRFAQAGEAPTPDQVDVVPAEWASQRHERDLIPVRGRGRDLSARPDPPAADGAIDVAVRSGLG